MKCLHGRTRNDVDRSLVVNRLGSQVCGVRLSGPNDVHMVTGFRDCGSTGFVVGLPRIKYEYCL